jgi:hypothetical protein
MTLPNFLIVGAQKCGTTTLHQVLHDHPEVNMSAVKEINYFTSKSKLERGLQYYSSFFDSAKKDLKVTGEASPGYICYPGVAQLIREALGEVKIVMILRDPVKRAYSQYWDNRRHLSEPLDEVQIIDCYLQEEYDPNTRGYFSRGIYIKFIEKYLEFFTRDKIHVMILEDLTDHPQEELRKLFNFLGIDDSAEHLKIRKVSNASMVWGNPIYRFLLAHPEYTRFIPQRLRRFIFFGATQPYQYPLPPDEVQQKLSNFYRPWNERLESFLGRKLNTWL